MEPLDSSLMSKQTRKRIAASLGDGTFGRSNEACPVSHPVPSTEQVNIPDDNESPININGEDQPPERIESIVQLSLQWFHQMLAARKLNTSTRVVDDGNGNEWYLICRSGKLDQLISNLISNQAQVDPTKADYVQMVKNLDILLCNMLGTPPDPSPSIKCTFVFQFLAFILSLPFEVLQKQYYNIIYNSIKINSRRKRQTSSSYEHHNRDACLPIFPDLIPQTDKAHPEAKRKSFEKLFSCRAQKRKYDSTKAISRTPCNHPFEECNENNCICVQKGVPCEKFCFCVHTNCKYAYPGCNCGSTTPSPRQAPRSLCTRTSCLCIKMGRECDPDLCVSCCGGGTIKKRKLTANSCQNLAIQKGDTKQLFVTESSIAGFGAFLAEPVKEGRLIEEYVGEIITTEESTIREQEYAKQRSSYLFACDDENHIDSTRMGNFTRFINHSDDPNCTAKVTYVLGENRVGFYALCDIKEGDELTLDYGYDEEHRKIYLGE